MIAKRVHAETFGFKDGDKLIVTGGASANKDILQVIADVFQLNVFIQSSTQNSAAMGAAYRALYGVLKSQNSNCQSFHDVFEQTVTLELACTPDKNRAQHYQQMALAFKETENKLKA